MNEMKSNMRMNEVKQQSTKIERAQKEQKGKGCSAADLLLLFALCDLKLDNKF